MPEIITAYSMTVMVSRFAILLLTFTIRSITQANASSLKNIDLYFIGVSNLKLVIQLQVLPFTDKPLDDVLAGHYRRPSFGIKTEPEV